MCIDISSAHIWFLKSPQNFRIDQKKEIHDELPIGRNFLGLLKTDHLQYLKDKLLNYSVPIILICLK